MLIHVPNAMSNENGEMDKWRQPSSWGFGDQDVFGLAARMCHLLVVAYMFQEDWTWKNSSGSQLPHFDFLPIFNGATKDFLVNLTNSSESIGWLRAPFKNAYWFFDGLIIC